MSKTKYHFIGLIIYMAVGITAIMSAQYGWSLAGSDSSDFMRYVTAATFALFDIIIMLFAAEASAKRLTKTAMRLLFVTLFSLSVISGAAFMVGQQAKGQGMRVAMLERQIDRLDSQMGMLDPVKRPGNLRELRKERERAYYELQMLIERQGGEITQSNALFVYVGKTTGIDADFLSSIIRVLAMINLNLCGIVLAAWREQSRMLPSPVHQKSLRSMQSSGCRYQELPIALSRKYDLYEDIKQSVIDKRVRPSVAAIAQTFCSNSRKAAGEYLEKLEKEGVIRNMGHGKRRIVLV